MSAGEQLGQCSAVIAVTVDRWQVRCELRAGHPGQHRRQWSPALVHRWPSS